MDRFIVLSVRKFQSVRKHLKSSMDRFIVKIHNRRNLQNLIYIRYLTGRLFKEITENGYL